MKGNRVSLAANNLPRPAQYHQRILWVEEIECRKYQSIHFGPQLQIQAKFEIQIQEITIRSVLQKN